MNGIKATCRMIFFPLTEPLEQVPPRTKSFLSFFFLICFERKYKSSWFKCQDCQFRTPGCFCMKSVDQSILGSSSVLLLGYVRQSSASDSWIGANLISVWPTEATTLLLSTSDRSELPQSVVVGCPPITEEWWRLGRITKLLDPISSPGHWLPLPWGLGAMSFTYVPDESLSMQRHLGWARHAVFGQLSKTLCQAVWSTTYADCVC